MNSHDEGSQHGESDSKADPLVLVVLALRLVPFPPTLAAAAAAAAEAAAHDGKDEDEENSDDQAEGVAHKVLGQLGTGMTMLVDINMQIGEEE